jgi:prevent-host-death family protein
VNIHQAKTHLSRLLEDVGRGEEVVIAKAGRPVARLVPVEGTPRRKLGMDAGRVLIADDFDAPLPESILTDFER